MNLTDKTKDLIIFKPDAKTKTAIENWLNKLKSNEQENVKFLEDWLISLPSIVLDEKRSELLDLVKNNQETDTPIFKLRYDGLTYQKYSVIVIKTSDEND